MAERVYDTLAVAPRGPVADRRLADLDALRAIAALLVLANHASFMGGNQLAQTDASPQALLLHGAGAGGVSLFFALSGFLIAGPFLRSLLDGGMAPDVRRYLVRRATRILPAYWVALTAAILLIAPAEGVAWWQVPIHFALLQTSVPGESVALLLVAWSLCLEAAFYVFVPIAAAVARRLRRGAIGLDALAAGVLALWGAGLIYGLTTAVAFPDPGHVGDVFRMSLAGFLPLFCPGLLVFLAETDQAQARGGAWAAYRALVRRPAIPLALAVLAWLAGNLAYTSTTPVVVDLGKHLVAVSSGLALATACQGLGWMRSAVGVLAPIGLVSYGVYLWHWIVVHVLIRHDVVPFAEKGLAPYAVHLAVAVAITLPVALASWLVVERPVLRRSGRAAPAPAPIAPLAS